jgi:hypothetical protein
MTKNVIVVEVPFTFPVWSILLALAGTILLALLIIFVPIRLALWARFAPRPRREGSPDSSNPLRIVLDMAHLSIRAYTDRTAPAVRG